MVDAKPYNNRHIGGTHALYDTYFADTLTYFRYLFRDNVKPHENVAKRVFKISQQQIRVDYHFVDGRITNNAHIYDKDGSYSLIQVCIYPAMSI